MMPMFRVCARSVGGASPACAAAVAYRDRWLNGTTTGRSERTASRDAAGLSRAGHIVGAAEEDRIRSTISAAWTKSAGHCFAASLESIEPGTTIFRADERWPYSMQKYIQNYMEIKEPTCFFLRHRNINS